MSISFTGHRARVPPSGTPIQRSTSDVSNSTSCFGASAMLPPDSECPFYREPRPVWDRGPRSVLGDETLEAELLDAVAQGAAWDPQPPRGARHVAAGLLEHRAQEPLLVLDLAARFGDAGLRAALLVRLLARELGDVLGLEHVDAVADQDP